ncbi:hypothetical protein XELAEV_18025969mg [Xenopus laevis]|uniref:Uncharacterized protein n=1 Tax=Xenopus laevis TaxID=8355 RepID=A0A974D300_XENLA|nr:hypothetical protein XELAEV_18025969mg [Xenopus laevis]
MRIGIDTTFSQWIKFSRVMRLSQPYSLSFSSPQPQQSSFLVGAWSPPTTTLPLDNRFFFTCRHLVDPFSPCLSDVTVQSQVPSIVFSQTYIHVLVLGTLCITGICQ